MVGAVLVGSVLLHAGWQAWLRSRLPPPGEPARIVSLELVDAGPGWGETVDPGKAQVATRVAIPDELTEALFRETMPRAQPFLWKGGCLGVVRLNDGSQRHIIISYYGGTFRFEGEIGHYEAVGESRRLLEATVLRIVAEEFIPKRQTASSSPATQPR